MRNDDCTAVPVDGMVQLLADLLQTIGNGLLPPLGQSSMTTAPSGIIVDMLFQRCVTKQVGMKNHSRITFRIAVERGGYLEHLTGIDQSQRSPIPVFIRPSNQCVEIARSVQILAQSVAGQIGKTDQWMQRLLSREFIKQIYRNNIIRILLAQIHILFRLIMQNYPGSVRKQLSRLQIGV